MILIDGKKEAAELREELKKEVLKLKDENNKVPGLRIEIVYVDLVTSEVREHSFDKGEWHKKYKIDRNEKGQYNGKVLERA